MKINACDHLIFELLKLGVFLQEVLLLRGEFQLALVLTANLQSLVKFAVKNWQILAAFTVIVKFTTERNLTSVLSVVGNSFKGKTKLFLVSEICQSFTANFPTHCGFAVSINASWNSSWSGRTSCKKIPSLTSSKIKWSHAFKLFTPNTSLKTTYTFFDSRKETSYMSNSLKINVIFKVGLNNLKCVLII